MVDTKDLKSFGHCGCAGSSPAPSTEDASNEASFFYSLRENMDGRNFAKCLYKTIWHIRK